MSNKPFSPGWLAALLLLGLLAGGVSACGGGPAEPTVEPPVEEPPVEEPPVEEPPVEEPPVEEPPVELPPEPADITVSELPLMESEEPLDEPPDEAPAPVSAVSGFPDEPPPDDPDADIASPDVGMTEELPIPEQAAYWETEEYKASRSLRLINASEGYALADPWLRLPDSGARHAGAGITVMVLDSGVDPSHPDLGYVRDYFVRGAEPYRGHGTQVAGVIAARKNRSGVHGVAYNVGIVSMGICFGKEKREGKCQRTDKYMSDGQFFAAGIASAAGLDRRYRRRISRLGGGFLGLEPIYSYMYSNPDARADIINMSFGGEDNDNNMASAMQDAAAAGRIMVAALGNDEGHFGPIGSPASNVTDPGVAGFAIAVGSMNKNGTGRAYHSNTCGPVAEYCIFAPGEYVLTTNVGGGYVWNNGTSFAAPHVSGAAAVLWAVFPYKSADEIVNRLLGTARPITEEQRMARQNSGGTVIDPTFGWGALNLGNALAPIYRGRGLVIGGSLVPVADTYVTLPPGFAAPGTGSHALANTIIYDGMMFPFYYDLAASFRTSESSTEGMLEDFLSQLGTSSNVSLGRAEASLQFVHDDEDEPEAHWDALEEDDQNEELDVYRFSLTPAPGVRVTLGQGFGSTGSSNGFITRRTNRTIFGDAFSVAPFAALAGRGPGFSVGWQVDRGTTIDLVGKDGRGYSGSSSAQLASLGLTREIADGVTLGMRYGSLREKGSLMGIRAAGAFANEGHATTDFVDVSMEGRVADDMTLFGSVSQGITGGGTRGAKNSLVSEWSAARAGSFVIGTEFEHFLQDSDRLTVTASSPFRADRATVHLDVPDRELADQVVAYSRRSVDLVPSGREHRLQWVYEMKPGASWLGFGRDALSLAVGSYVRMEAGHDETADPDYGAAAKIRASF